MPTFLLKAKNLVGKAAKGYAKNKAKEKLTSASTDENGETNITNLAGKVVLAVFAAIFIFMTLFMQLVDSSNYDTIFGAVGGFKDSDSNSSGNGTITGSTEVGNTVINCALEQKGKPYVWGAEGPDSFDCSGLVKYCYEEAGISVIHQTESIMSECHSSSAWEYSYLSDDYKAYPGDILYRYGHAGIVKEVDSDGKILSYVHAPTFGAVVRDTDDLSWSNFTEVFHYVG